MIKNTKNDITYLTFNNLSKMQGINHLFSTRLGGVSEGIYESMNLSYSRDDKKENVDENFSRIASLLGCSTSDFVSSVQTHTTNVRTVTKADAGKGFTKPTGYNDVDGLITNESGLVLVTYYADCVPLFFVDPVNKAIGLSHSGWRGTVGRMGQATLNAMASEYGTRASDVVCAIGPSICQSCYEVSEDVADEFSKEFPEHTDRLLISRGNGKYLLNLWEANRQIMLDAGVKPENIEMPEICTCCNSKLLFSHRATQGKRGNLAAFLTLK